MYQTKICASYGGAPISNRLNLPRFRKPKVLGTQPRRGERLKKCPRSGVGYFQFLKRATVGKYRFVLLQMLATERGIAREVIAKTLLQSMFSPRGASDMQNATTRIANDVDAVIGRYQQLPARLRERNSRLAAELLKQADDFRPFFVHGQNEDQRVSHVYTFICQTNIDSYGRGCYLDHIKITTEEMGILRAVLCGASVQTALNDFPALDAISCCCKASRREVI